jgi:ribosomal protein L35
MQKSFSSRLKVTKRGKVQRRATTLGHSRMNKSGTQLRRKRGLRGIKGIHHEDLSKNLTG